MCGLFGVLGKGFVRSENPVFDKALDSMSHRGPDGRGVYLEPENGLYLGHRRLAIIDPANGAQPMTTHDGALTVVFNGAIYNYLELRRELIAKGHPIQSYCDTEVLLYAYREWGEQCVDRFWGMFAFAIWDSQKKTLFCARDRVGIKPFYYAFDGTRFIFASEAKGVVIARGEAVQANPQAILDYITFQHCLGPKTLFSGIDKLEPGQCMTLHYEGDKLIKNLRTYWDLHFDLDEEHDETWFIQNLGDLIEDALRIHLRSDVPLGAYLSGGLDSSTVTCMSARLLNGETFKTFTGAFHEGPQFDETHYAKIVAQEAKAQYNEIFIDGKELPTLWPELMRIMDEPMAGPGLIPQYYVSKLASQHVKVALGGQGGDEIFTGYARYLVMYLEQCMAGAIWETSNPSKYAVSLDSIIPNLPLLANYKPMMRNFMREGLFESSDRRYFRLLDRSEGMAGLLSADIRNHDYNPFDAFSQTFNRSDINSLANKMMYFDLKGSLPALLHVEDRASMAASLESRVPLLDHRIIEFMARVPTNIKFKGGCMKHMFKEAVKHTVPAPIMDRKDKMGFPTPLPQWTKGCAKDFVMDTLLSQKARSRGFFDAQAVEAAVASEHDYGRVVWGLMCMELWHKAYVDGDALSGGSALAA